ncbi:hypothetical protein GH733_004376 [Mirounga leonina]|nr:hypothetical protein GH733_004376 [Mirounga leonina]
MTTAARPTSESVRDGRGKGEGYLSNLLKQYSRTRKTLKIAEEQAWKEQEQKAEEDRISIENVEWKSSP